MAELVIAKPVQNLVDGWKKSIDKFLKEGKERLSSLPGNFAQLGNESARVAQDLKNSNPFDRLSFPK